MAISAQKDPTVDDRHLDLHVPHVLGIVLHDVAVDDNHIGQLASFSDPRTASSPMQA
jgi:hypothetical protein